MTSSAFADVVAQIAGELTYEQVSGWAAVLDTQRAPEPSVARKLIDRCPGPAISTVAARLIGAWRDREPQLPGMAVALALRSAARAHKLAEQHRSTLVVSGPTTVDVPARLTPAVAAEIVRQAREKVLIVSYVTRGVEELVAELHEAVRREVQIDLVLERSYRGGGTLRGASDAFDSLKGIANFWRWPAKRRTYFKRSRPSLHAKIVVADAARGLVTSANMTDSAFDRNLEIGVILRDPHVVGQLDQYFRSLMEPDADWLVPRTFEDD